MAINNNKIGESYDNRKRSTHNAYENTPEFCKSSEVKKAESEARQRSSGSSLGDSVKQGVGVGIGLKLINSIL